MVVVVCGEVDLVVVVVIVVVVVVCGRVDVVEAVAGSLVLRGVDVCVRVDTELLDGAVDVFVME